MEFLAEIYRGFNDIVSILWISKIQAIAGLTSGLITFVYFYRKKINQDKKIEKVRKILKTIIAMSDEERFSFKEMFERLESAIGFTNSSLSDFKNEMRSEIKDIHDRLAASILELTEMVYSSNIKNEKEYADKIDSLKETDYMLSAKNAITNSRITHYVSAAIFVGGFIFNLIEDKL